MVSREWPRQSDDPDLIDSLVMKSELFRDQKLAQLIAFPNHAKIKSVLQILKNKLPQKEKPVIQRKMKS